MSLHITGSSVIGEFSIRQQDSYVRYDPSDLVVSRREDDEIRNRRDEFSYARDDDDAVPADMTAGVSNAGILGDFIDKIGTFVKENPVASAITAVAVFLSAIVVASKKLREAVKQVVKETFEWVRFVNVFKDPNIVPNERVVLDQLRGLTLKDGSRTEGALFDQQPSIIQRYIAHLAAESWNDLPVREKNSLNRRGKTFPPGGIPTRFIEKFAKDQINPQNMMAHTSSGVDWSLKIAEKMAAGIKPTGGRVKQQLATNAALAGQSPEMLLYLSAETLAVWKELEVSEKALFIDIDDTGSDGELPLRYIKVVNDKIMPILDELRKTANVFAQIIGLEPRLADLHFSNADKFTRGILSIWENLPQYLKEKYGARSADRVPKDFMSLMSYFLKVDVKDGRVHATWRGYQTMMGGWKQLPDGLKDIFLAVDKQMGFEIPVDMPEMTNSFMQFWLSLNSSWISDFSLGVSYEVTEAKRDMERIKLGGNDRSEPPPGGGLASSGGERAANTGKANKSTPPAASAMTMVPQVPSPAGVAVMFGNVSPVQWTAMQGLITPLSMVYPGALSSIIF